MNISGKPAEDLFAFSDTGPIIARYEADIANYLDTIEKANKEKELREEVLKQAQEGLNEAIQKNNDEWQKIVKGQEKQRLAQEKDFKELNEEWQAKLESHQKEFNEKIKTIKKTVSSGKNVDENKLREEVEVIKVQLNMSIIDNEALKGEISDLRLENEKLRDQSVKDVIDMADISKKNEDLLSMVIKKSTLVEEEHGESEVIGSYGNGK